jgi:hypothetical protein
MKNEQDKISFDDKIINWISKHIVLVFFVFIIIVIVVPNLFARLSIYPFIKSDGDGLAPNEIGDAIGGMTAPIIGLFSAFLVYVAFRAQIKANEELQKFNEKQVSYNELNEILLLEKNLDDDCESIWYSFHDKNITKEIINYKGRTAFNNLRQFLINYKSNKLDDISLFIQENTLLNFIPFLNRTTIFYTNLFWILEYVDDSKINTRLKNIIVNKLQLKYLTGHKDLDYLIENYKNESNPKLEATILRLFKTIKSTNDKFDSIITNLSKSKS